METCDAAVNITVKQESGDVDNPSGSSSTIEIEPNYLKSTQYECVFLNEVKTESVESENGCNESSKIKLETEVSYTDNREQKNLYANEEKKEHIENETKDGLKIKMEERPVQHKNDVYKEQIEKETKANHLLDCEKIEIKKHELPENCIVLPQKTKNDDTTSHKRKRIKTKDCSSNDNIKCIQKLRPKPAEDEFYNCPHCNRSYKRKADLTVHINIKHKEGEENTFHKCQHCEYQSPYLQHVNRHEREKHISEKSIACSKCSYVTTRKHSLRLHMNTHAQTNMFKCKFCDYQTKLSYVLAMHISNKHSKQI